MNLENLFKKQQELKDHIGYYGLDRFNKLILALFVEVGECANEWRGFKFWSENQKPRTKVLKHPEMMEEDKVYHNPLLEEYVDGLHFVLELGLELGLENQYKHSLVHVGKTPLDMFNRVYKLISDLSYEGGRAYKAYCYEELINHYLGLGKSLGFSWDQIEIAYLSKNQINHERQENGY
jgi:dimeric dUTPase (all-alpha-NTP-PPase superfamily)